ncbi:MAG: endonuclease/exonuclease/phosphatase family protein, partial [Luteolibacter sp.]
MGIYRYISRKLLLQCLFPLMAVALITHIASASQLRVATFNIGATFGDTYFIYSLGDPGTADHETVRQVLDRIDADVVALQEIHSVDLQGSPDDLDQLASSLGYDFVSVPPVTGVFDTSLRVVFLSRFPILQSTSIASPDGAKEITRRHAAIRVDVPGTDQDPWLISPHMKAGTTSADRFRRAIEMRRLVDFIEGDVTLDDAPWVVLGDFNPSAISSVFDEAPSGLPSTYLMGTDLSFPIRYHVNPIDYFSSPVFRLDPRQLNGSAATYQSSGEGPILDLILVSQGIAAFDYGAEVYNSAIDFDNLSGLQKRGSPLDSAVSATASDHYAVFADLLLPSISTYQILQSGQAIVEDFSRISGLATPEPWSISG